MKDKKGPPILWMPFDPPNDCIYDKLEKDSRNSVVALVVLIGFIGGVIYYVCSL